MVKDAKFKRPFWLLCFSSFLFFSSFTIMIMELPSYLESMGGLEHKGLLITLFTLSAGLSRPIAGKLADKIGRIPIIIVGTLVAAFSGLLYPFATTLGAMFALRFFHGFATGFKPTGSSAYVSDIVSANRRGEAMGIMGMAASLGLSMGPALGSYLVQTYSYNVMFATSSLLGIMSFVLLLGLEETVKKPEPFRIELLKLKKEDWFEWRVISAALVMLLAIYSYGAVLVNLPEFSLIFGITNKGSFLTVTTLSAFGVRIIAGKAADKYGRYPVIKMGLLLLGHFHVRFSGLSKCFDLLCHGGPHGPWLWHVESSALCLDH